MNIQDETHEVLLMNRQFLYSYVGRAFAAEPDDEFLQVILDDHAVVECSLLDDSEEGAEDVQRRIQAAAKNCKLDHLASEYTKLFVGPVKPLASPWESVYATGEPLLFQENTLRVREVYRAAGFRASGYPKEPDDHIAIELNFMAKMAFETIRANRDSMADATTKDELRSILQIQRDFLSEHLLTWVDQFSDRVSQAEGMSGFYSSFAELTTMIVKRDVDIVGGLLAD